jgi:hypothetical protein
LVLAGQRGRIQLVLRNPLDAQKAEPPGTAVARLFRGGKGPAEVMKTAGPGKRKPAPVKVVEPPPAPPPPPIVVELLKGPARSSEKFQPGEKVQP